jgi:hypothetical protein
MNMLVSATAIAAATPAAASAKAHDVLVTELYPPTGPNSSVWSAITLDGQGQRWAVSASNGETRLAFREDRKDLPRSNGQFCWYQEHAPETVRNAVVRAIAERGGAATETIYDPVYAAIERHRQVFLVYNEAIDERTRCEAIVQERGALTQASVTLPCIKVVDGQPCLRLPKTAAAFQMWH